MNASNANDPGGGSNTITLATGVSGTITLSAVLRPTMNVTILGPGAPVLTISGNPAVRLFQIAGIVFTLQDVTLSGGAPSSGTGGAVYAFETSGSFRNVNFVGNTASDGGAIYLCV